MSNSIKSIKGREILDSRGEPTLEVLLKSNLGFFRASVPSGLSTGKYEAKELRDNEKRFFGKGVLKAVENVNEIINKELKGKNPVKQKEIDQTLIELDATDKKSKLGANAILGVSLAVCRAGAATKEVPLWKHLSELSESSSKIPTPCFNVINGGVHAGNDLDIQEFMIIPFGSNFKEKLRFGSEVYHYLKEILRDNFGEQSINVGDEGGFAPPLRRSVQALRLIKKAVDRSGYEMKVGLDCAASCFFNNGNYELEGGVFTSEGLLKFYQSLIEKEDLLFLEDPFEENDWKNWKELMKRTSALIIGDDLLATNPERIKEAHQKKACNGMILKPNQIGTISESLEAAKLAKSFNWKIIVSHRSGETCDSFISDLGVGIGANFIKSGAPCRGERVAKYNRLLEIEEEL